jgi:hypothetical protein
MTQPPAKLDYHANGDGAERPSPFDDDAGPLTWRIVAWRAGLILVLSVISLTLLVAASWVVMRMYR